MRTTLCFLFACMLLIDALQADAQKLPNKQEVSVYLPNDVKIDGLAKEWNNQFKAYNSAVDIFYSIANDADNLYLIVYATKPRIIDKIIDVGVTLIINTSGKKNDEAKDNIKITYPDLDVANGQRIIINAGKKAKPDVIIPKIAGRPVFQDTTDRLPTRSDSLVAVANELLQTHAKMIKVEGIAEIPDNSISIYNEENVKVAARFDNNGNFTYELSVPLKYLGNLTGNIQKFSYNIRLNSRMLSPKRGMNVRYIYPNGLQTDVDQDLDATTDFWGEYTLAKKT